VGLTVATAASLGLVVLIATIYIVIRPEPWVEGFVSLFPAGWRQRTREILQELYHTVQRWFIGQLTAMSFIAVFWAVSLSVIGVPFALLLGILGGLISFVPYVGATISVVVPLLLALISEPFTAVYVIVAFVIIQQIEGNILQPLLMSRAVDLHRDRRRPQPTRPRPEVAQTSRLCRQGPERPPAPLGSPAVGRWPLIRRRCGSGRPP
jgi:predicted PurR-regulated permease PerM